MTCLRERKVHSATWVEFVASALAFGACATFLPSARVDPVWLLPSKTSGQSAVAATCRPYKMFYDCQDASRS